MRTGKYPKKNRQSRRVWIGPLLLLLFAACSEDYTPKPRGYFRIDLPEVKYQMVDDSALPYVFEISTAARRDSVSSSGQPRGWLTLHYPEWRATLYCSYLEIHREEELAKAFSDVRRLVGRQQSVEAIQEKAYQNPQERVYGSLYFLAGDCVSPVQFALTDSMSHFFRGALYYDFTPKADSIAPVTDYLQNDIIHLIETFSWK